MQWTFGTCGDRAEGSQQVAPELIESCEDHSLAYLLRCRQTPSTSRMCERMFYCERARTHPHGLLCECRVSPLMTKYAGQGGLPYMTSALGGGSPKSRQRGKNQLISVRDKGGMEGVNNFADVIYGSIPKSVLE